MINGTYWVRHLILDLNLLPTFYVALSCFTCTDEFNSCTLAFSTPSLTTKFPAGLFAAQWLAPLHLKNIPRNFPFGLGELAYAFAESLPPFGDTFPCGHLDILHKQLIHQVLQIQRLLLYSLNGAYQH